LPDINSSRRRDRDIGPVAAGRPPAPAPVPLLLDSRGLAEALGIGRTKAYELMFRNEVPTVRIGRCVRVPQQGLVEWIAGATSPALAGQEVRR
jgi:excisionase family DNA binding protein